MLNLSDTAKKAYKLEASLGWDKREPLASLQDFADELASHYNTPPVVISSNPKARRIQCLGLFKSPNRIIVEPVKGQTRATILHEFTHYLDWRERKDCPHDNKFRSLHKKILQEMANAQKHSRPNLVHKGTKDGSTSGVRKGILGLFTR